MSIKDKEKLIESLEQQISDTIYATQRNPFRRLEYAKALGIYVGSLDNATDAISKHAKMLIDIENNWDWMLLLD